jgi:hypothetical protein
MPNVHRILVDGPSGKEVALIWNIDASVGGPRGTNHRFDAMLVQFLLFDAGFGDRAGISGSWNSRSQSQLKSFEAAFSGPTTKPVNTGGVTQDGVVDRMRPGQIVGSISHLTYKMNLFNRLYVHAHPRKNVPRSSSGGPGLAGVEVVNITMDDMLRDPNMPDVLQTELKRKRDAFFASQRP